MITKEEIREYAVGLKLSPVGFADAFCFDRLREILEQRHSKGYLSGLETGTIEERCCPDLHLEEVRTIISAGLPYLSFSGEDDVYQGKKLVGFISGSAVGEDYHRILKRKLEYLAHHISEKVDNFKYRIMVDTGPLVDREIAYRAGLGWYGKNCNIITTSYGSAILLGEMLTNLELEPDKVLERDCGECNMCLEKCPTGALISPYVLDAERCISYLTQMRGVIPRELRNKIGASIYGCDRCQQCCPHNTKVQKGDEKQIIVVLKELLDMSKKRFAEEFKNSAAGWRGLNILKRNAVIALGNHKSKEGFALLEKALKHPSSVIRGHAAWAVGQIGGKKAEKILKEALAFEKEGYVLSEIQIAIEDMDE